MTPGVESTLTGTLNGWTEGPGFFRRGDYLYMTYAGNNVISDAYRVGYSYQHGSDPTGAFIMPENNLLLLCTDPKGFRGLGHNSNVIGPDLDSWYATYHCLVSQTGPQRRYMVDRLLTAELLGKLVCPDRRSGNTRQFQTMLSEPANLKRSNRFPGFSRPLRISKEKIAAFRYGKLR